MTEMKPGCGVSLNDVRELIARSGYELVKEEDSSMQIKDLDSGVTLTAVLENDILFNTVACMTVPSSQITPEMMKLMLSADNGISTSAFQLYERDGKTTVTLSNFAKLQQMGADDEDDILSCLSYLIVDAMAARSLLQK